MLKEEMGASIVANKSWIIIIKVIKLIQNAANSYSIWCCWYLYRMFLIVAWNLRVFECFPLFRWGSLMQRSMFNSFIVVSLVVIFANFRFSVVRTFVFVFLVAVLVVFTSFRFSIIRTFIYIFLVAVFVNFAFSIDYISIFFRRN